ncbi:MAG TPA: hypothetical protein VGD14_10255 [bacterium]
MQFIIQVKEPALIQHLEQDAPPGISVHAMLKPKTRSFGFEGVIPILVQCAADVGIGLLSAWLYDKLKKGNSKTVIISRQEIEITPDAITKFISEKITIEKRDS